MVSTFYFSQKEKTSAPDHNNVVVHKKDTAIEKEKITVENIPQKAAPSVVALNFTEIKTVSGKKEISLPDGSTVVLNRQSKIRYADNFEKERIVYLSGEAFFDVKPHAGQSFVVQANLSKTKVVGTSFIIKSYKAEVYDEINVVSGKVSFDQIKGKGNEILILAGNKGTLKEDRIEQSVIKDANYNSWLTEKIVFKNTKLAEVFRVLEEHYNVSMTAQNPKILNCEFTGEFEKSNINEILEVLSISFNLSFNQESKNYVLSGKGCR